MLYCRVEQFLPKGVQTQASKLSAVASFQWIAFAVVCSGLGRRRAQFRNIEREGTVIGWKCVKPLQAGKSEQLRIQREEVRALRGSDASSQAVFRRRAVKVVLGFLLQASRREL